MSAELQVAGGRAAFDVERVRRDFPILGSEVRGQPLVYLDNAATTQKPRAVVDAISRYYLEDNANIHRGVHQLSERATRAFEDARDKVRRFLNAPSAQEVVFVRGATEAINLVAGAWGRANLSAGDEVVITGMEHHSNIVPWQVLRDEKGIVLKVAPIDDRGELLLDRFEELLGPRTKLVSFVHASNTLGTVNPARRVVELAHARGIPVLVDAAQSAPHLRLDVQALGCDFLAMSGHKVFGPTGIGVLWGRAELLEAMPPYQAGGDMILTVSFEKTLYNKIPHKFEAGTPDIAGAIGLGAAIDYLESIGFEQAIGWEHELLRYATERLSQVSGLRIVGTAAEKIGAISFVLEGIHPHDIGTLLDQQGIAIRTGHHCTEPLMRRLGLAATARVSLAFYNTRAEVDRLVAGIEKVKEVFA